eukprot:COSAG04_NODE_1872_length_5345_cov_10.328250_2_plen_61_part_00
MLIAQLEALLRANDCAVSGVEVVFDAEGKGYVIDVNTCNTSKPGTFLVATFAPRTNEYPC